MNSYKLKKILKKVATWVFVAALLYGAYDLYRQRPLRNGLYTFFPALARTLGKIPVIGSPLRKITYSLTPAPKVHYSNKALAKKKRYRHKRRHRR